jgi:hypothetical protein
MTYPQQPYGQDPYGQGQQPGQYGGYQQGTPSGGYPQQGTPSGGYPQQGGQYGGYDPTAQYPQQPQYGGYPGGQYGGGYGGPPQKKNTGMIVAIVAIVVLVLGGLGITGFVAPGFFLSDDKNNAGGGGSPSSTANKDSGLDAFVDDLVKAADGKDKSALRDMTCADADSNVQSAIDDIDDIDGAELKDTKEEGADKAVATLDITVNGDNADYDATLAKDGSDWCWQGIEAKGGGSLPTGPSEPSGSEEPSTGGGGGGGGGSGEGEQFVQDFLDQVNSGDAAGAKTKLCPDSSSQGDIEDAVQGKANLQMDTAGMESQEEYVGVDLKGTLNGAPTSAARTSAFLEDGGWCIFTFYAF